ncbi:hypothetical protein HDU91_000478, partial [Kappamyces sp. JEL0680]
MTILYIYFLITAIYCKAEIDGDYAIAFTNSIAFPLGLLFLLVGVGVALKINQQPLQPLQNCSVLARWAKDVSKSRKRRQGKKRGTKSISLPELITAYIPPLDDLPHISIEKSIQGPNTVPLLYEVSTPEMLAKVEENIPDTTTNEEVSSSARENSKMLESLESIDSESDEHTCIQAPSDVPPSASPNPLSYDTTNNTAHLPTKSIQPSESVSAQPAMPLLSSPKPSPVVLKTYPKTGKQGKSK